MLIQIEPKSDVPIFLQLVHQLIEGVVREELKPGDPLPSVRRFAADLCINMHTVNKAYHELEAKDIIQIIPKSGVIIHPKAIRSATASDVQRLQQSFRPLVAEALVLGLSNEDISKLLGELTNEIKKEKSS